MSSQGNNGRPHANPNPNHNHRHYQQHGHNHGPKSSSTSTSTRSPPEVPMSGIPYGHLPAFLPGSASLVEQLDRRIMIILRDGRHLIGTLRSFDQFSNMVLQDTCERRVLNVNVKTNKSDTNNDNDKATSTNQTCCYYTDIRLGLYLIRGDSMVLLGEVLESENDEESSATDADASSATNGNMIGSGLLNNSNQYIQNQQSHPYSHPHQQIFQNMNPQQLQQQQKRNDFNQYMKKITLEEFEKMQKIVDKKQQQQDDGDGDDIGNNDNDNNDGKDENGNDIDPMDKLEWEFDSDLVV